MPGYNAQQVLQMISDLKPDVLERFVTGAQNLSAPVPVAAGAPPMTAGEFLNASTKACNCYVIPRISLNEYDKGTLFQTSESLLSLAIQPTMVYLSLDDWTPFVTTHTPAQIEGMFQELYAQGWHGIGVNDCGGVHTTYGYATFADFCIDSSNWMPNGAALSTLKSEPSIKLYLLYIDFPQPMQKFMQLPVDEQASVLANNIGPAQSRQGFVFVYPIVQDFWDSNNQVTSASGPYHGETLYVLMKGLMNQYNTG
jgi:hypothetical protein